MRRFLTFGLTLTLVLSAAACNEDDDPTGPDSELFVGTFTATTMIFRPDDGPALDLVAFGAALTVTVDNEGEFTWTATIPGSGTETEQGVLIIDEASSTVTVDFETSEDIVAEYEFHDGGDTLVLTATDVSFDLDNDGVEESGTFEVQMVRQ